MELDGRGAHLTRFAFEDDRARDAALTAAGYRCLRFTAPSYEDEGAVAEEVTSYLCPSYRLTAMRSLTVTERDCLDRYCTLLRERLGSGLVSIQMFGSAARGDMWAPDSPMHSDVDLLVTSAELSRQEQEELLNATYPLYLECGRQLSPQFFTEARLSKPEDQRTRALLQRVLKDAVSVG